MALRSVLDQQDVDLEIIVVNDHSSDRTGAIADAMAASEPRMKVIHNPALPPGWLGKCNAMQQAAAVATGEVILFTDGDIVHAPRCFVTALAEMERRELDFLSLFPLMECVSFCENVILPAFVGGLAMLATPGIEDPARPDALAAGAFLMIRAQGIPTRSADSSRSRTRCWTTWRWRDWSSATAIGWGFGARPSFLQVRLYKDNRHAFWGMTKNVLEAVRGRLWLAPVVMLLPAFVYGTPVFCAIVGFRDARLDLLVPAAGTYPGIQYAMLWVGHRLFRFRPLKALLFPLVAVPVICCMARGSLPLWSPRRGPAARTHHPGPRGRRDERWRMNRMLLGPFWNRRARRQRRIREGSRFAIRLISGTRDSN